MATALPLHAMIRQLPQRAGFDTRSLRVKVGVLAALARAQWIARAQERFRSTARDYVRGIQPVRWVGQTTAQVALVGSWPNALEQGRGPWDLRTTLLVEGKVRSVRRSKDGFLYLAVPFRHMGPATGDRRAMGRAYQQQLGEAAARDLGRQLSREAKQLTATRTALGQRTGWGGRLDTTEMGIPLLRSHHTTDIYAGMVRQEKTYRAATQSQYTTWRMISTNPASKRQTDSGRANWTHPGLKAALLAAGVREWLSGEIPRVMGTGAGGEG